MPLRIHPTSRHNPNITGSVATVETAKTMPLNSIFSSVTSVVKIKMPMTTDCATTYASVISNPKPMVAQNPHGRGGGGVSGSGGGTSIGNCGSTFLINGRDPETVNRLHHHRDD